MLDLTNEDRDQIDELAQEVLRSLDRVQAVSPLSAALVPLIWQEIRMAHVQNKSLRIHQEMQKKSQELGANQVTNPVMPGYYHGSKL